MVTHFNLLWLRMKEQDSECTRIISLLRKIFGKLFKLFHMFVSTADKFIKIFSLYLFLHMTCVLLFLCAYVCIYAHFICNFFVCVYYAMHLYCTF